MYVLLYKPFVTGQIIYDVDHPSCSPDIIFGTTDDNFFPDLKTLKVNISDF